MSKYEPIIYVDHSEVREGKLEELKIAIKDLAELVEMNEPRIISYSVFLSGNNSRMAVVHVHPDSASLELHGKVAGPAFAKFVNLVKLLTIDVYGEPSDAVLEQLRNKVKLLGNATLIIHKYHAGFARFGTH